MKLAARPLLRNRAHENGGANGDGRPLRIAYLTTVYPSPSHAFIAREVAALRARGMEIETFAIRRGTRDDVLSAGDAEAARTTTTLRPVSPPRLLAENASLLAAHRSRYPRSLAGALSLGRGARGRLWQSFYFSEAVLLARHCARVGAGHIHAHFGYPPGDVAMLAARLLGLPWSLTLHGTDVNFGDRRLLAAKVREATFVVCVGEFARDRVLPFVDPAERDKVHLVRCGLEGAWFEDGPPAPARERARLLSVARFEPPKDPALIVEAVAELRRRGRDLDLVLVGDGPLRAQVEGRIRELGLTGSVTLAGGVGHEQLQSYYRSADVFCLSSSSEGVPVVLMEAMASRVPVVAPRLDGVRELVDDERSGLLFRPGDAVSLASSLERLVSEPELGRRLAQAGRARVETEFRIERSAAELERLFLDAARSRVLH
ncbi:MAG TPA: glycosyltransferase [Gaiellaceae bacterium]|nr:glycosyltransferase [Gaiellaceae bacterium]